MCSKEQWNTSCEGCGTGLDAWQALYNYHGLGPYCQECIDDDDELEGLKWEYKAEFWQN